MKTFRIFIVHFILLSFIAFISFWALYVYQYMPEAHNLMQKLDNNLTFATLLKNCFWSFGFFIITIYSFYFFVFDFLFRKKLTPRNVIITIILILTLIALNVLFNHRKFDASQISGTLIGISFFGGVGLGARAIIEYFKTKEKQKELERKNLKIELDMLRSRINPHFLFNTLNNIDALIRKDPDRASELLIKLSSEMRYMLYDSNADKVSLASEVEFIKDYVSLQKLRFKNPELIELIVEGEFDHIMIPPMLFIPFIENAFKYCNKFDVEKVVAISLTLNNNQVFFSSTNAFDPESTTHKLKTGGIGLEVVEKRLDLLYPDRHELTINKADSKFEVSLKIQLDAN